MTEKFAALKNYCDVRHDARRIKMKTFFREIFNFGKLRAFFTSKVILQGGKDRKKRSRKSFPSINISNVPVAASIMGGCAVHRGIWATRTSSMKRDSTWWKIYEQRNWFGKDFSKYLPGSNFAYFFSLCCWGLFGSFVSLKIHFLTHQNDFQIKI